MHNSESRIRETVITNFTTRQIFHNLVQFIVFLFLRHVAVDISEGTVLCAIIIGLGSVFTYKHCYYEWHNDLPYRIIGDITP